jgi:hypothetical protein
MPARKGPEKAKAPVSGGTVGGPLPRTSDTMLLRSLGAPCCIRGLITGVRGDRDADV